MPPVPELSDEALQPPAAPLPDPRRVRAPSFATIVSLAISATLLTVLYRGLNLTVVAESLRGADLPWLAVSLGMIVPITVLRAIRFLWVAPAGMLRAGEALRVTLVATALNAFAPAKTGDLIKSYLVAKRGTSAGVAVAIIVYERLCDLLGLIFWCMVGWVLGAPRAAAVPAAIWPLLGTVGVVCALLTSSEQVANLGCAVMARALPGGLGKVRHLAAGWPALLQLLRGRRGRVMLFSLFLWLVHLVQIWMFTLALSLRIPFLACASLSAIALMAGQLPLTFAGLGARDVALVVLLRGHTTPEAAAALGLLIATRNLLPPLAAIPIMRPYIAAVLVDARRWRDALPRTA
jgi:glycosyltransferase 2 family protein